MKKRDRSKAFLLIVLAVLALAALACGGGDLLRTADSGQPAAAIDSPAAGSSVPVDDAVTIAIVDPDEPAVVSGRIRNESGIDTSRVSVALFVTPDTTTGAPPAPPTYYTVCDSSGNYELSTVHAGTYRLWAFVDVLADSLCGQYPCGPDSSLSCAEPCVLHPDSVVVQPGDVRKMNPIELSAAPGKDGG